MVNVIFIDYATIIGADGSIVPSSIFALKEIAGKVDDIRIVCLENEDELVKYDAQLPELSQELNLKKSLFFDKIAISSWKEMSGKIASWISTHEVKSFAIVSCSSRNSSIGEAYPNNSLFCDASCFSEAHAKDIVWIMSNFKSSLAKNDNVWFTSDTHFGHGNIIKYCNRPWNSGTNESGEIIVTPENILAMDNEMIKRWNSVVGKDDIVWHLGDFALGGKETAERVFPQLNGKINLVLGNHDHWKIDWYYNLGFHRVYDRKVIINEFVILTHAPLQFLNENCPFYQIFGHVHDSSVYQTWTKNSCCVCVERHDYYPVSWKTIKDKYDELNIKEDK